MSVSNSRELLSQLSEWGFSVTDHLVTGASVRLLPGSYTTDWENGVLDTVTFAGTSGRDALFAGGGEAYAFFMATPGDDLYAAGTEPVSASADYSAATCSVFVDMSWHGSRTYIDADGETRTIEIFGKASDGLGGTDYFGENAAPDMQGRSGIGIFGSRFGDVMIGGPGSDEFNGGAGNDRLIGDAEDYFQGGDGCDLLVGGIVDGGSGNDRLTGWFATGDDGNDWIVGADDNDHDDRDHIEGGTGNDRIFAGAGNDQWVTGEEGNDFVDGGAGSDFIDGGVGADILVGGAGSDTINPDVEFFQYNPTQARDGARDLIVVTKADLGAWTDTVIFNAFEEDRDRICFAEAVWKGTAYRVTHAANADDATRTDTVLQIDSDGDGLGGAAAPDADDYFLTVLGADLSLGSGYILT